MSEKLLVPDIGDFENVEVIEILVKPGDQIKQNDPIVTIESDKSSVEIPSTIAGKVDSLAVKVGDKVSKGDLLLNLTSSSKKSSESTLPKDTENIIKQAEEAMAEKKEEKKIISEPIIEKKQSLQAWVLLLSILAFLLSVVGTFLVRSGILTSVHTFA